MLRYYTGNGLAWKWSEPLRRGAEWWGQKTEQNVKVSPATLRPDVC